MSSDEHDMMYGHRSSVYHTLLRLIALALPRCVKISATSKLIQGAQGYTDAILRCVDLIGLLLTYVRNPYSLVSRYHSFRV